ncbi:MAG: GWxTD domain-containing protein [bacterium]
MTFRYAACAIAALSCCLVVLAPFHLTASAGLAHPETPTRSLRPVQETPSELYGAALQDLEKKNFAAAETKLRTLLKKNELYQESSGRSAWHQLGLALERQNKPTEAIEVLEKGYERLRADGRQDWFLNYDLARLYAENRLVEKRKNITPLIYALLENSTPADQPDLWQRISDEMLILLKEPERSALQRTLFQPGSSAGAHLLAFLEREDPYPNTSQNEYLRLFFQRTTDARHRFGDTRSKQGYDQRGEIYVRLGEPYTIVSSHSGVKGELGWALHPYEVWFYSNIHPDLYYTFIMRRGDNRYTLVQGPESILGTFYKGRRTFMNRVNVGEMALRLRNELYSTLAGQHETFRRRLYDMSLQPTVKDALEYAQRKFIQEDRQHLARLDTLAPAVVGYE